MAGITAIGLADDLWSRPERGWRAPRLGPDDGCPEAGWHPGAGGGRVGSVAGGLTVGLAANALNQLDTRDRAARSKAFLGWALWFPGASGRYAGVAVLLLPYDLREVDARRRRGECARLRW